MILIFSDNKVNSPVAVVLPTLPMLLVVVYWIAQRTVLELIPLCLNMHHLYLTRDKDCMLPIV